MIENARISVQGKGAIHVVPDVMRIEVKVQSVFPDYQQAYAQAKENFGWMVKILEYNKKQGNLAKTIRFDITDHLVPEYNNAGKQIGYEKDGFDLEQCIKVDLPVDNVLANNIVKGIGKFIPDAQIDVGYTLQDPRPSQLKMLARSFRRQRKSQAYGGSCGMHPRLGCEDRLSLPGHTHILAGSQYPLQ